MAYSRRFLSVLALTSGLMASALLACGSSAQSAFDGGTDGGGGGLGGGDGGGGGLGGGDAGGLKGTPGVDANISMDAYFANDPAAMYCGVDGGSLPPVTGPVDCPSDKNRQGCPCSMMGQTAACWPGLRVDRDVGQCKDGTTTCESFNEGLSLAWGPCVGYVLPTPGAEAGAAACQCFSSGQWKIDNVSPCFITSGSSTYAVSTTLDGTEIMCPSVTSVPPPVPTANWSTDTLTVDCEGSFTLCYTLKAGSAKNPLPTDCTVASVCTQGFYSTAGMPQTFPPLPGWAGSDPTCAAEFNNSGGYGVMTVKGLSERCEAIDGPDGGAKTFNILPYCPSSCNTDAGANGPGCAGCQSGGSGTFGQ